MTPELAAALSSLPVPENLPSGGGSILGPGRHFGTMTAAEG